MQLFLLIVGIFRILQSCVELCVGDGAVVGAGEIGKAQVSNPVESLKGKIGRASCRERV